MKYLTKKPILKKKTNKNNKKPNNSCTKERDLRINLYKR